MKSSLIEIKIGNPIIETSSGRVGTLKDIKLTPNGMTSPDLVVILYVEMETGNGKTSIMSATSNRFRPLDSFEYEEFYPSVHMNRMIEKREKEIALSNGVAENSLHTESEEYKLSWS